MRTRPLRWAATILLLSWQWTDEFVDATMADPTYPPGWHGPFSSARQTLVP